MIINRRIALAATLCALGWSGAGVADTDPAPQGARAASLEVTMRIIEDPDAVSTEAITRRLELPSPRGERDGATPPGGPADGEAISEAARELGREFGEQASDQARDLAEQASGMREEFGRTRAEEARPELPERPEIEPPVPPRP
jgi:hypothetical protein